MNVGWTGLLILVSVVAIAALVVVHKNSPSVAWRRIAGTLGLLQAVFSLCVGVLVAAANLAFGGMEYDPSRRQVSLGVLCILVSIALGWAGIMLWRRRTGRAEWIILAIGLTVAWTMR